MPDPEPGEHCASDGSAERDEIAAAEELPGHRFPWWLDLGIVLSWIALLVEAWYEGQEIPVLLAELPMFPDPSWQVGLGLLLVVLATGVATFAERKRIVEDMPIVTRLVDRWFGAGAYRAVNARLRPVLFSILGATVLAVSCAVATPQAPGEPRGLLFAAGAAAAALGFTAAFGLSRRFPPRLH